MNILQRIAATKRAEIESLKRAISVEAVKEAALECDRPILSLKGSILSHNPGIIAEHKRRSPSKGEIAPISDVGTIASGYADAGAAAMSVLTDTPYFGGSLTDLAVARSSAPELPLLRKEFIIDPYQIFQARTFGADAVLLIAALLKPKEIACLTDIAHSLGLQTLVEVHSLEEVASIPAETDLVGVNNRDLTSFSTDISNSARLVDMLPKGAIKIAESGIHSPEDLSLLRRAGFDGFLIGEAFMSTPSPAATLRKFINQSQNRC